MMHFYYQRLPTGVWGGRKESDRPDGRRAEGARRKIKQILVLPPHQVDLAIKDLEKLYPLID